MTLQELYQRIDGDYEQAVNVMRMEKLIDKHIRKLPGNKLWQQLAEVTETLDATGIFECTHAIKGVCANLGLMKLSAAADELTEEFRPGNKRSLSDETVREKLQEMQSMYALAADGIRAYEEEA